MKRIVDPFRGFILGLSLIWMPLATAPVAMAQDSTELQKQLAEFQQRNAELQAKLAELEATLAKGQAVADQLRAENEQLKKALAQSVQEAAARIAAGRDVTAVTDAAKNTVAALQQEVESLRQAVAKLQSERDKNLKSVVELTDQLHQAFNELKRLKELNARLSALLPKPPENVLEGVVTAVQENGLVEVSLGSDDGLLNGHRLSVYRMAGGTTTPLGQLDVVSTTTDKSVCKVDPNSLKSPLQKGDRVTSGNLPQSPSPPQATNPDEPPRLVDGTVLALGNNGEVEISFGAQHGLKAGHRLEVYRLRDGQGIYVGRIEVLRTEAEKSVCKSILEFEKDTIRKGDSVVSKID